MDIGLVVTEKIEVKLTSVRCFDFGKVKDD